MCNNQKRLLKRRKSHPNNIFVHRTKLKNLNVKTLARKPAKELA
jgi:hypothetical protein